MLQRHSAWSSLLLSSAVLAACALYTGPAWSQEAAPAASAPASAPAASAPAASAPAASAPAVAESAPAAPVGDLKLKALADDFMHYSIVGNTLLAKDSGQAILDANPDPKDFLTAFEAAANGRDFRAIMQRNQRQADLKDVSKKLADKLEDGYRASARNPERIKADIKRLGESPRAYANAKEHLIAAGPFAAQYYIAVLNDESQKSLQPYVIRLMTEIGKPILAPVLEQLHTPQAPEKIALINIVGQIGYPQALPTLKAILAYDKNSPEVLKAAQDAIHHIDPGAQSADVTPSDAFYKLALQYYQNRGGAFAVQYPDEPTNPVFFYDPKLDNVVGVPVPTPICQYVEAMRSAEASLKLQPNDKERGPAISLWLAADMQRELHLGASKDPTRAENVPDATYYAMAAGPIYVNTVLQMALDARDSALALKTIPILEATGGTQGLVSQQVGDTPLVQALSYPDRAVRFGSAFALARANPAKIYPEYFRVVPVLAEAIGQTGAPNALLVEPNQDNRNRIKGLLAAMNPAYNVFDGPTLSEALNAARKAPAFDLVLVPATESVRLQELARTDYRLTTTPVLALADKAQLAALHAQFVGQKGVLETDIAADDKALAAAIESLRAQLGQTPVDATVAQAFSATSLKILNTLAVDHASIYSVKEAIPTLIDTLKDKRPEILTAAANVLGQLETADGQKALAASALAEGVEAPIRQALLVALAESAKHTGNILDSDTISKLIKEVATEQDANVRAAAATALGALNVQTNQAAKLILDQAH